LAIIQINNLTFEYNNDFGFKLFIENWKVEQGSFVSIVGPNGCGKSTFLKILAGINIPHSGRVLINGKSIKEIKRKNYSKFIAYVPQSLISVFPFTVHEIVMMGRTPYLNFMGFEKENDCIIVDEAIKMMELNNIKNKCINEISGGELQRVFIARALAQKSEIILLDEPNSHLDIQHQIVIFELLQKLSEKNNLTIISVSHDLNMVGMYSKEVIFMRNGMFEITGNKKKIFTKENIKKVFNVNAEVYQSSFTNSANVLIKPNDQN